MSDFINVVIVIIVLALGCRYIALTIEQIQKIMPQGEAKVEAITITGNLPAVGIEEISAKPFIFHNISRYQTGNKEIFIMQLALGGEPVIAWTDNVNVGWKLFQQKKGKGLMYLMDNIIEMDSK